MEKVIFLLDAFITKEEKPDTVSKLLNDLEKESFFIQKNKIIFKRKVAINELKNMEEFFNSFSNLISFSLAERGKNVFLIKVKK